MDLTVALCSIARTLSPLSLYPFLKAGSAARSGIYGNESDWLRAAKLDRTVGKQPGLGGSGPLRRWAGSEVWKSSGHLNLGFSLRKKIEKKIDCSLLQTQWLQIILKISFLWKNL